MKQPEPPKTTPTRLAIYPPPPRPHGPPGIDEFYGLAQPAAPFPGAQIILLHGPHKQARFLSGKEIIIIIIITAEQLANLWYEINHLRRVKLDGESH